MQDSIGFGCTHKNGMVHCKILKQWCSEIHSNFSIEIIVCVYCLTGAMMKRRLKIKFKILSPIPRWFKVHEYVVFVIFPFLKEIYKILDRLTTLIDRPNRYWFLLKNPMPISHFLIGKIIQPLASFPKRFHERKKVSPSINGFFVHSNVSEIVLESRSKSVDSAVM